MKKHYIILTTMFVVLAVGALFIYNNMGGFSNPATSLKAAPNRIIVGKMYEGTVMDKKFGKLFNEIEAEIKKGKIKGKLAAYYFNNPDKNKGKMKCIVGILLEGDATKPFEPYVIVEIPERKVIRTTVKAHISVAANVYKAAEKFAEKNNLKYSDENVLEIYPSENEFIMEAPIK